MSSTRTGRLGWPLVPSPKWPGEVSLSCPKCGSTDIEMSVVFPDFGTGPMGIGRMLDPGALECNECRTCKHHTFGSKK